MIKERWLLTLVLTGLVLMSCEPLPSQAQGLREKVVLIFCDVTSSLDPGERNEVVQLTAKLVRNLKPPVRYKVLPILLETDRAQPLLAATVPILVKPSDKDRYQKVLARIPASLNAEIGKLYAVTNGPGVDPNRSCIINSLQVASGIFDQYRSQKNLDLHMIIVSDMLEECDKSPYGSLIQLNKPDIQKEIETARKAAPVGRLMGVNIALVVPTSKTYSSRYAHPTMRQLGEFWRTVFRQAGLGDMNDPNRFYFGPGLPDRLQQPW